MSVHTHTNDGARPAGEAPTPRIEGVVLLAGGLTPPELVEGSACSVLDLHVGPDRSLLDLWLRRIEPYLGTPDDEHVQMRVLCGSAMPKASMPEGTPDRVDLRIERDASDYRGPAGAVHDAHKGMGSTGTLLVGEANRCIGVDLGSMLHAHAESGAVVTVGANADNTPAGLYLIEPRALDLVLKAGFMDMKEQWLKRVADAQLSVRVFQLPQPGAVALRTLTDLVDAVRGLGKAEVGASDGERPGSGEAGTGGRSAGATVHRSVVSSRAGVSPGALVVDSIVMPGATIERGATVVRSLVTCGAVIEEGAQIVDAIARSSERGTVVSTTQRRQRWAVIR